MTEESIFLSAMEQNTPAERTAYLDGTCAGDPALRQRVEALLRSHADPDSFLDVPAIARQMDGTDEPLHTTDLPAAGENGAMPQRRQAVTAMRNAVLALLEPGRKPNSLGRLDHYEMVEVAGEGGMGVVFKAYDTRLKRIVAVKVLAPHLAANATARERFVREAQSGAAVRDNHVVAIHAVSDEGSVPYLAMEFIGGVTLEQRIKQGRPMEVKEVLRIGMQAAEGLAAAHKQGLVHRDVKPANILLENGVQRVKITDFGLARATDDASLTQPGLIAGTPLYMSPEQARGEMLDQRSDLFSLGSVLYTLCAGQAAFSAGNTLAVLKRVCEETPRPMREINPDIPEWLADVVSKLLAKEKGERFQSAAELADLLGQHLAQIQQSSLAPRQPEVRQGVSPAALPAESGARARKRNRLGLAALLAVVVVASLVSVVILSWPWLFPPSVKRPLGSKFQPPADDPRVLTVSKKPEDGGRFRTITEALDKVEPEMTIRVLDDAVYEEYLLINRREQHRGVVLETSRGATIRRLPDKTEMVWIRDVPGFTLRGFRFESGSEPHAQVNITRLCPGVVLERLDMKSGWTCVHLHEAPLSGKDEPIVIRNCVMRRALCGVCIEGYDRANRDRPQPSGHVVIRNNTLIGCNDGVVLRGAVYKVHVVGNRVLESGVVAIDLDDLLPGAADILIANNTLLRCESALRVWDEHSKGKDFLKCKNIRVQNNLVLEPRFLADLIFFDHARGNHQQHKPGDLKALLDSPQWRFSHNWREIDPVKAATPFRGIWIPGRPNDQLQVSIKGLLSRTRDNPDFLRPAKNSPLAKGGVKGSLPAYVGAVPPEGVEPWHWEKTWKTLAR